LAAIGRDDFRTHLLAPRNLFILNIVLLATLPPELIEPDGIERARTIPVRADSPLSIFDSSVRRSALNKL
jgi:hypothetical protein